MGEELVSFWCVALDIVYMYFQIRIKRTRDVL